MATIEDVLRYKISQLALRCDQDEMFAFCHALFLAPLPTLIDAQTAMKIALQTDIQAWSDQVTSSTALLSDVQALQIK